MKIFVKRPLSLILCIMLGGFSLYLYTDADFRVILIALPIVLMLLTFIKGLIIPCKLLFTRICIISFFISILLGGAWSYTFFPTEYLNNEYQIKGVITDINAADGYHNTIIKTETINGNGELYKVQAYIYGYNGMLKIGDVIECNATLISTGGGKDNENRISYNKDGISAILQNIEDFKVVGNKNLWLTSGIQTIRKTVTDTFIERTNSTTGGFISALLIGERDYLNADTALSFRRIGISHILALSGMHLSIMTLGLERLLSLLRVPKASRILLTLTFTILYMAISGFTPSITRSGIMLIIYYTLFLLARSRDALTSLCISVALIVTVTPYAIFDISLWLSAFATLGIITAPLLSKYKEHITLRYRLIRWFVNSFLSSFFALGCTILITTIVFENISLLSIVSTVIFTPITTIFMYASIILLLLGGIIPLGNILIIFSDAIKELAELLSRPTLVLCSIDYPILKVLIFIFTALLLAFLVLDIKRKKRALIALSVFFLSIYIISAALSYSVVSKNKGAYITNEESDCILLKNNGEVYMIVTDSLDKSYSYAMTDALSSEKLTKIDELVLTGYSDNLDVNIQSIINYIKTDLIRLPYPENSYEEAEAKKLSQLLSTYGTYMRFYSRGDVISVGEYNYRLIFRTPYTDSGVENVFTLTCVNNKITYFTSGAADISDYPTRTEASSSDVVIVGNSGKHTRFNLKFPNIDTLVVANSDILNSYAKEFYISRDIEIIYPQHEYKLEKGRD